jgi:hypothetical protein
MSAEWVQDNGKQWMGHLPDKCQICERRLTDTFVDGKINGGVWGIMCPACHKLYGNGLGIGKGQQYRLIERKKSK